MKKLSKITLQDAVVLQEKEMKTIFGGSGGGSGSSGKWCYFSDGEATLTGCNTDADCEKHYHEGKCK